MIWNEHARFLYRGATHWANGFSSLLFWTKPDYPLLLPIFIAQIWSLLKSDTSAVSSTVAFVFTLCGAGVLYFGLRLTSNRASANVALLTLLVSPYFCRLAYSQLADVPIAFYFLSATVFLTIADKTNKKAFMFFLVGCNLSAAIWTKNDGAIYSIALGLSRVLILLMSRKPGQILREGFAAACGAIPIILATSLWKIHYAPSNERLAGQNLSTVVSNLSTFSRHVEVLKSFFLEAIYFAGWTLPMTPLFIIYKLCMVRPLTKQERLSDNTIGVALIITVLAYYVIFMLTQTQLDFDLATTLPRLLMQIYPTFLYWLFFSSIDLENIDFGLPLLKQFLARHRNDQRKTSSHF
jgi:hypothetical protein